MKAEEQEFESTASPVQYAGYGRDELGRRYLVVTVDGTNRIPVDVSIVGKDQFFSTLNAQGASFYHKSTKDRALRQIEALSNDEKLDVASRLGWHRGHVFVFPNAIIGEPERELVPSLGHIDPNLLTKYGQSGTLESWQSEVLSLCTGNSRLMFGICLALASPVAALVDEAQKTGGCQVFGPRESGKTTCGTAAGSVWGCYIGQNGDRGFAESWNITENKIEEIMAAHNHVGLILDETTLFPGDLGQSVMRLSEGTGKKRMYQDAVVSYEAFFFSTSNVPTWDLVKERDGRVIEAVLSRIMDIPLPEGGQGIFENLHHLPSGRAISNAIKHRARDNFGVAGRVFIEKLVSQLSSEKGVRKFVRFTKDRRAYYLKIIGRRTAGVRFLERPADRCATIYATACLAQKFGILTWNWEQMRDAILSCHVDATQATQPFLTGPLHQQSLPKSGPARLQAYIAQHGQDFVNLDTKPLKYGVDKFGGAKGYRAKFKGKIWYYFNSDQLKQILGGAAAYKSICKDLVRKKLLDRSGNSMTTQRPVYRGGKGNQNFARVVAIRRKAFAGGAT